MDRLLDLTIRKGMLKKFSFVSGTICSLLQKYCMEIIIFIGGQANQQKNILLNDAATLKSGPKVSDQDSDQDNSILLEREILKFCRKPKSKKDFKELILWQKD